MKNLQQLGRVLSKQEQVIINGGINPCGTKCSSPDERKCCVKIGCQGKTGYWCPLKIPAGGVTDDVPTIV